MELKRFLWHRLPLDDDMTFPPWTECDPLYQPWGVTIYRTAYDGPSSDWNWQVLLDNIQTRLREGIQEHGDRGKDDNETVYASQKLMSLFRLDARSDPQTLAGVSIKQLREIYKAGAAGGQPMNTRPHLRQCRLFLLADEEVLASVGRQAQQGASDEEVEEVFVKCVDPDYRRDDHGPPPSKRSRIKNTYFGWEKLATRCLLEFWMTLEDGGALGIIRPAGAATGVWVGHDDTKWKPDYRAREQIEAEGT